LILENKVQVEFPETKPLTHLKDMNSEITVELKPKWHRGNFEKIPGKREPTVGGMGRIA
jgi:hypothetical protein